MTICDLEVACPRVQVQHAVGAISAIVDALPPSSTKPPQRSRKAGAGASDSPLAAIAEDEQAPAAASRPQQRRQQQGAKTAAAASDRAPGQEASAVEAAARDAVVELRPDPAAAADSKAAKGRKSSAKAKSDRRLAQKRPAEAATDEEQPAIDGNSLPVTPAAAKPAKRSRKAATEAVTQQNITQTLAEEQDAALEQSKKAPVKRGRKSEVEKTAVPAAEPEDGLAAEGDNACL
jgi:hypothetical protein